MAIEDCVLYMDPSGQIEISYDGKNFNVQTSKKSLIGSRVSYNDVILHSFKVPVNISEEELKSSVEIKTYEDAGLDLQKKYKITYIKKELDFEENFLIEAFAVEIDSIKESLSYVLNSSKHIDFLALPFLSFSTLYTNKIIAPKNDLFIYFDKDEAFISIYKDGKYLSSKSVMNLDDISKKLESAGLEISVAELTEHLMTKGLDATLYERGENVLFSELEAAFSAIFTKVNDIVLYNRSVFGFENIDRIFLSMKNGRIKGMKKFIQQLGFEDIELKDFNLFKEKSQDNLFENIVVSYINDKVSSREFIHNVSIFNREAAFYNKESGKVLIGAFSILILCFAYFGFLTFENSQLEKQEETLQKSFNAMKKTQSTYKKKIADVNSELFEINSKKEKIKQKFRNISNSMDELESLRDSKNEYSKFILRVNTILAKHNLATTKILLVEDNHMSVEIVAEYSKRDSITKFMEDLIAQGFVGITTDEIKSDKDIYISRIEIKK